jgi:hypothetical protein
MKTGVISTVVSTLKLYGNRLDDFQTTITGMGNELSNHQSQIVIQQRALADQEGKIQSAQTNVASQQENITNQYRQISSVQSDLAIAQTNLNVQAAKIQNVEFLVDNLFSKMVFAHFSTSDTNQVATVNITNDADQVIVKLTSAPIPGSIQTYIRPGGPFDIPQNIQTPLVVYKNVIMYRVYKYDMKTTLFSIQYVIDTRETNLFQTIVVRGKQCFVDNMLFWDASIPDSFFLIHPISESKSK